jgi:hypothetical protein
MTADREELYKIAWRLSCCVLKFHQKVEDALESTCSWLVGLLRCGAVTEDDMLLVALPSTSSIEKGIGELI